MGTLYTLITGFSIVGIKIVDIILSLTFNIVSSCNDITSVKAFDNYKDALDYVRNNPLDLAFLDINPTTNKILTNTIIKLFSPAFGNSFGFSGTNAIMIVGKNYGKNDIGNNEKINIEYVSANPTGTLHIGHGRGAVYGDNLSRIMSFCGYDVTREYYINDAGNQMNNLGISIKERYKEVCGLECNLPEDGYHGKEIITIAKKYAL